MFDSREIAPALNKLLVVLHQEQSTCGRIGYLLKRQGYELDVRRPRFGDDLPATMDEHAGAIFFGGPMSANDADGYVRREIDWINLPLKARKPFLGVCLGAQMLARCLGARVYAHPEGRTEIGYYGVRPTEAGHATCPEPFPDRVYHWHGEGFDLPDGATLLAEGDDFAVQAMRFGPNAYGLQFHPEVTYAMICRWTVKGAERLASPGAQPGHQHRLDWHQHDSKLARWCSAFLDVWPSASAVSP